MVVCNIEFKRSIVYEDILDKLNQGLNVYLCGGTCIGKSTMVNELQYDLKKKCCYISLPKKLNGSILDEVCEQIALQLNIEVGVDNMGDVSLEVTLTIIKELGENILFIFDEMDNIEYAHPDFVEDINEWIHDLCMLEGCQVVCVGQSFLNKTLPYFFRNKSWRQLFDIVSIDKKPVEQCTDIKSAMSSWFESELLRGEYSESFLKLITMGICGEMSLGDAVKAANAICGEKYE